MLICIFHHIIHLIINHPSKAGRQLLQLINWECEVLEAAASMATDPDDSCEVYEMIEATLGGVPSQLKEDVLSEWIRRKAENRHNWAKAEARGEPRSSSLRYQLHCETNHATVLATLQPTG